MSEEDGAELWKKKKKMETLRVMETKIAEGVVGETILDDLETVERLSGYATPESIVPAYSAVAVECTAAILLGGGGSPGARHEKCVDRIWRQRIGRLVEGERSKMVSAELKKWRQKMELSLVEHERGINGGGVCAELCASNTRNHALRLLHAYLKDEMKKESVDLNTPNRKRKTRDLVSLRRKTRRWSSGEEAFLRDAVGRFGSSSWKNILARHPDRFVGRTEVDLKDKWRNMAKYTANP